MNNADSIYGDAFTFIRAILARAGHIRTRPSTLDLLVANLVEREREMVEAALQEAKGVVGGPTGAAAKLGIPRQTLESKIRKLGINRYLFKTA